MSVQAQLARGTKIFIQKDGTPDFIQIKEVRSINASGAEAEKIDCTDLDSLGEEFLPGTMNHGTVTLDIMVVEDDPGQAETLIAFKGDKARTFKVETKKKRRTFSGTVTKFPTIPAAQAKEILNGTIEIQINGEITVEDNI